MAVSDERLPMDLHLEREKENAGPIHVLTHNLQGKSECLDSRGHSHIHREPVVSTLVKWQYDALVRYPHEFSGGQRHRIGAKVAWAAI
jgi:ABC-type oligopeptide transport system ATPase subunit